MNSLTSPGLSAFLAPRAEEGVEDAPPAHAGELPHALGVALLTEREEVDEEVLLAREVVEQTRRAHADALGDHRERRPPVAIGRERFARGAEDRLAACDAIGVGAACGHGARS